MRSPFLPSSGQVVTRPGQALRRGKTAGAFSLIQLITVIGLIAVLSALLLPVTHYGLESSREAKCASQLRQIHLAMMNYAAENQGRLTPYLITETGRAHQYWVAWIRPYFSLPRTRQWADNTPTTIYACPSDTRPKGAYTQNPADNGAYGLCGLNGLVWGVWAYPNGTKPSTWRDGVALTSVKQPARTAMLFDHELVYASGPTHLQASEFAFRHKGKINVIFFDGHVRTLSKTGLPAATAPFWNAAAEDP